MKRLIAVITLPLSLLFAACDGEPVPPEERAAEEKGVDLAEDGHHEGRMRPDQRLCAELACTDAQSQQIEALFAAHRPPRGEGKGPPAGDPAANAALADKLRAGALTVDDILANQKANHPKPPHGTMLVELHKILDAGQRAAFAEQMADRGPFFGGHPGTGPHGERGDHHGRGERGDHHGRGDGDEFRGHGPDDEHHGHGGELRGGKGKFGRLCAIAECTDDQREALRAKKDAQKEARKADREAAKSAREAAHKALADAFRRDTFGAADVERFEASMAQLHQNRAQDRAALLVDFQSMLSADQRAKLADAVAREGLGALGGEGRRGKHGKHGKHGKRGKHGGKHGERGESAPA